MKTIFFILGFGMLFYSFWSFLDLDLRNALWSAGYSLFLFYESYQSEGREILIKKVKRKEAVILSLQAKLRNENHKI